MNLENKNPGVVAEEAGGSTDALVDGATVRVMRSHDYCHFEVVLSYSGDPGTRWYLSAVDGLRKAAARLVDKAVEEYKIKKASISRVEQAEYTIQYRKEEAQAIEAISPPDRTPEQQATLKAYYDAVYEVNHSYDYQDED